MVDTTKNLIVYHGSYVKVDTPDLSKCKDGKDFGKGFYVTTDKAQAEKFAKIIAKRNGIQTGILNEYVITDFQDLSVFEFPSTDADWLHCVIGNRDKKYKSLSKKWESYDICIGKIADDDTSQVINAYMAGAYGKVSSKKAVTLAVEMFKTKRLKDQICLRSKESLSKIKFISSEEISI